MNPANYLITNKINGKVYVGKSINPYLRWKEHKNNALVAQENNSVNCSALYKAMIKYGIDNFEFEIISESKSEQDALDNEILLIAQYKSNIRRYGTDYGYNLTDGGENRGQWKFTKEQRDKLKNRKFSNDHKQKLSKAHLGKKLTKEHIHNMSNALRGLKRSKETKANISKAKIGIKNPMARLKEEDVYIIKQLFTTNNYTISEIAANYGVSNRTIRDIKNNITWKHIII